MDTINPAALGDAELLAATHDAARRSSRVEAELLVLLGEIDARKLYCDRAYDSMFSFCVGALGFSEGAAYNRIAVAKAARRFPAIVQALQLGRVHLAGLRLLAPYLTEANCQDVLARAAGKTKRQIEEQVAAMAPRPPVPQMIRKLPSRAAPVGTSETLAASDRPALIMESAAPMPCAAVAASAAQPAPASRAQRPVVAPLAEDAFKIQFTASRAFRDKLRAAQDLLRHRFPDGNLEAVLGAALDVLVERVNKERFAVGRKPRQASKPPASSNQPAADTAESRHISAAIMRAVHARDEGACAYVDDTGRRCGSTSGLEFDHIEGFARTHSHSVEGIRLACKAHNLHLAEKMYGRAFIERARARRIASAAARRSSLPPNSSRDESAPACEPP